MPYSLASSFPADILPVPLFAQSDAVAETAGHLGKIPYVVLGGYLLLLLLLGIVGWLKSSGGEEDYYLAGREQGWLVSSLTIMATFFSSFALLGAPGLVYKEGVALALFSLNVPVAGLAVYLLGSRIWKIGRRLGYVTPGDMVADYYGSRVSLRVLVAISGVLYTIPYVVMQIQAGGLLSQKMFGEGSFALGATLLAAITTLYIMIGGMRSVAWTDVLQGLLLIFGMMVCGGAMLLLFDGPAGFSHAIDTQLPESSLTIPGNSGGWPWTMIFTVCLLGSAGSMVQPAQWMRFYSARNVRTLRRGAVIFAAVLTTCFILGVMLIGLAGQVLYPLQFSYNRQTADGPEKLEAKVPKDLRDRFAYAPPSGDHGATLKWNWTGKKVPPLSDADARRLRDLSKDKTYQASISGLQSAVKELRDHRPYLQTADRLNKQNPAAKSTVLVLPNPTVDPDPTDRQDFDSILIVVIERQLPRLLKGFGAAFASLILVAIMAASMSTADSNLHALSAVLTRDIYDQFLHPGATERERVWIGRGVIVAATAAALVVVILGRNPTVAAKYEFMNMIGKMGLMAVAFSAQLLPIAIDILFLQKGTGKGAAAGLAAGLLVAFLCGPLFPFVVNDFLGSPEILSSLLAKVDAFKGSLIVHGSVWGLIFNIPVFVLVSLVTRRPHPDKVQQYRDIFAGR